MDTIQATVDTAAPGTKFQIFSGILKSSRSSDGKLRLHGVASSTTKDLHGDTMSSSAIEDMERAANNNLTIFLNHSYEVPEDVAGSVESARMKTRGVDADGNPNYDLDMDILVNDANERAVKAFEAIERGTKLGLSIGALIPENGARQEKKGGPWVIDHVDLLETSLVGIPANPRSWVEYAAKSLRGVEKSTTVPLGEPTLTLDGNNWTVTGTLTTNNTLNTTRTFINDTIKATTWVETRDGDKITIGDDLDEGPNVLAETAEPDITDAACPTCGKGHDASGCGDAYHKSAEPDVTDAAVTIIQIDTGDGSSSSDTVSDDDSTSQGAGSSNPGTGDGDYAADGSDAVDVVATADEGLTLVNAVQKYADAVSELVTAKQTIADLTRQRDDAHRERDAARDDTTKVLTETQQVLNVLADTPLVRRAVVREAQQALSKRLSGIYSESILKLMEKETND